MKKIIITLMISFFIMVQSIPVVADDLDEEDVSKDELDSNIVEASTSMEDIPKTSSRAVLILDKESRNGNV